MAAGGGIGHVVEHAEAGAEILGVGRQAAGGHGGLVELHIGLIGQGMAGYREGAGGIDAVQLAHAGRHEAEKDAYSLVKSPQIFQVQARRGLAPHGPTA